jgi:hypothetical protein
MVSARSCERPCGRLAHRPPAIVRLAGALRSSGALRRAAARNRERGWPIRWELGLALPLLARALCDDPTSLGGLRIIPEGSELWADPEDADDFERLADATLGDYEIHLEEIGRLAEAGMKSAASLQDVDALRRHGLFVARTMLEWKWGLDGRMGQWTEEDVEELLLDYAPRKLPSDEETIADAPACVAAFIDFLSGIRMLSGDLAGTLAACCNDLREEFAEEMRDRSRWGPAKAVAAQMRADFNARPKAERDEAFDSAVDRSVAQALTGDPEAPPPWEIGAAALGGRGDRAALAITWFPADEYRPALERWEELGERWQGVGHPEYVRRMEATFRGWERAGHTHGSSRYSSTTTSSGAKWVATTPPRRGRPMPSRCSRRGWRPLGPPPATSPAGAGRA